MIEQTMKIPAFWYVNLWCVGAM